MRAGSLLLLRAYATRWTLIDPVPAPQIALGSPGATAYRAVSPFTRIFQPLKNPRSRLRVPPPPFNVSTPLAVNSVAMRRALDPLGASPESSARAARLAPERHVAVQVRAAPLHSRHAARRELSRPEAPPSSAPR